MKMPSVLQPIFFRSLIIVMHLAAGLALVSVHDASAQLRIEITEGQVAPTPIAIAEFTGPDGNVTEVGRQLTQIISDDLESSGRRRGFSMPNPSRDTCSGIWAGITNFHRCASDAVDSMTPEQRPQTDFSLTDVSDILGFPWAIVSLLLSLSWGWAGLSGTHGQSLTSRHWAGLGYRFVTVIVIVGLG